MRSLSIAILIAAIGCSSPKMAARQYWPLNGVWVPISLEIAGKPLPPKSFANQRLEFADSNYLFVAESEKRGIVRYASANQMDIYGQDGVNKGKHFTDIYKKVEGRFSIRNNQAGDKYPPTLASHSSPGS